jgi:dihydrofolate reductase
MTRVVADISMSLDGYVTGPDPGPDNGLGDGGEALHTWAFSDDPVDRSLVAQATARSGAVVLGRRLFDIVDSPQGWSEEVGYGAREVGKPPFVVVTSAPPAHVRLAGLDWTFVTTGIADAIEVARSRATSASKERDEDLDVVVMGGGAVIRSALAAGLVDTLSLHLAPVVLGSGTPLFTQGAPRALVQREVTKSRHAVHIAYDVD